MKSKLWVFLSLIMVGVSYVAALNLGGENVPKDKILVYVLIGHSNMAGPRTMNTDGVTGPRIWNYQWFSTKTWVPAKETPGSAKNGLSGKGEGGPGMPFLKKMAAAYPGYHFGVVSNASLSATCRGINTGNNTSGIPADSNRYYKPAHLFNEIVSAVNEVKAEVTIAGIICMLGTIESTRTDEETCRRMGEDLAQLGMDLRAEFGDPNIPFIVGEYENGATGSFALTRTWPRLVDSAIKEMPRHLTKATTINSVGITMMDDHHYSTLEGEPEFAQRVVDSLQSKNWVPLAGTSVRLQINPLARFRTTVSNVRDLPFLLDGRQKSRKQSILSETKIILRRP